jgi:hypothetical protein
MIKLVWNWIDDRILIRCVYLLQTSFKDTMWVKLSEIEGSTYSFGYAVNVAPMLHSICGSELIPKQRYYKKIK